jgi:hypothetical protein
VGCLHCHSAKVVKNGEKSTGAQNFLCRGCGKQFQYVYKYKGANPDIKRLILSMLLRVCGVRDIGAALGVSRNSVLTAQLLPAVNVPSAIIMDNATFHKRKDIAHAIERSGHILEFLPPYSPDLNPIEHKWAQAKAIRKRHGCSIDELFLSYDNIL